MCEEASASSADHPQTESTVCRESNAGDDSSSEIPPSSLSNDESSSTIRAIHPQARPNARLEPEEKVAKRHLKRHLKQRTRIRKYEMRWSQACGRKDSAVAHKAESELRDYLAELQEEPDSLWYQADFPSAYREFFNNDPATNTRVPTLFSANHSSGLNVNTTNDAMESTTLEEGRRWMTREIWQKLIYRMVPESIPDSMVPDFIPDRTTTSTTTEPEGEDGPSRKHRQTTQARTLLNHMTKGTQTESMFENDAALIGYTRQKFMERALLALKSLDRLRPLVEAAAANADDDVGKSNGSSRSFPNQLWQKLIQVRSILSIGCGPGCDAVGVLAFLHHQQQQQQQRRRRDHHSDDDSSSPRPILDRMILMDYVMPRWKRSVVDHLIPILTEVSSKKKKKKKTDDDDDDAAAVVLSPLVSHVDTASCDVRHSLIRADRNCEAWTCLSGNTGSKKEADDSSTSSNGDKTSVDLIVVSYLLTETRDQWTDFFGDLLQEYCQQECLILLSEPSAWQLHSLRTLFADYIQGCQWLDSSRDSPDLQPLESRLGPAVLLIQTKATTGSM
jgi:hypothetical protein